MGSILTQVSEVFGQIDNSVSGNGVVNRFSSRQLQATNIISLERLNYFQGEVILFELKSPAGVTFGLWIIP
jgi:hypothetical protein